jgi:hypothetical protein
MTSLLVLRASLSTSFLLRWDKWNVPAGTEILQTGVNSSTNSKRRRTRGALNCSLLFDGDNNAFRVDVAVHIVFDCMQQHILVGLFLDRKNNIAAASKPI